MICFKSHVELRHLRYFVAVAEELHFGRAARRLHLSQPPLSAQIRALEDEVGARLLDRSRHHVALTDAGRAFLERARDILSRASAMAEEVAGIARGEQGLVRLGYTTTASYELLPGLLATLRVTAPGLRVRLREIPSPAQPAALRADQLDAGLACFPLAAEDLVQGALVRERMVCAVPAGHPLGRQGSLRVGELRGVPMVGLRESTEPEWAALFAAELAEAEVIPQIVAEADTKLSLLGLVAAGLGVALVSSSLATVRRPGVRYRPLRGIRRDLELGFLHRPTPSPLVRAVVAAARQAVGTGRKRATRAST